MKKPKLRELKEALKSFFSRPYTTKFPKEPLDIPEGFRGKPQFYEDECIGCGACAQVCPSKAIEMTDIVNTETPIRRLTHIPAYCINCQECERNCITGQGIKLTKQFDVSYFSEKDVNHFVEHRLVLCRHCGEIVGTEKHILWLIKRLGGLSFSQASYIEFTQNSLGIPTNFSAMQDKPEKVGVEGIEKIEGVERDEIFEVTCPKCRRLVYLEDEKIHF